MQADLGLCCSHMPEDMFSHGVANLKYTAKHEDTDAAQMMTKMMSIQTTLFKLDTMTKFVIITI